MVEIKGAGLYKQAKEQEISVGKFCDIALSGVCLTDNGDGHIICKDWANALAASEYASCLVERITSDHTGCISLWIPRKEED